MNVTPDPPGCRRLLALLKGGSLLSDTQQPLLHLRGAPQHPRRLPWGLALTSELPSHVPTRLPGPRGSPGPERVRETNL